MASHTHPHCEKMPRAPSQQNRPSKLSPGFRTMAVAATRTTITVDLGCSK